MATPPFDAFAALRAVVRPEDPGFLTRLTSTERLVLTALVSRADGEGRCHPSLTNLATATTLDRRTVTRTLAALEAANLIERRRRFDGSRIRSTVYTLRIGRGMGPLGAQNPQGHHAPRVGAQDPRGRGTVPPEVPKEVPKEVPNTDMAKSLWSVWLEELGGNGRRPSLTEKRRKVLEALHREQLAGEPDPLEAFRAICRAVKASPHHMATRSYQLPESLFRNPERRERWALDAVNGGGKTTPSPARRTGGFHGSDWGDMIGKEIRNVAA